MKDNAHPDYYPEAKVVCACGNVFTTGSTEKELKVDICSACHPFFTGQMKYVDTGGRVKRFEEKMKKARQSQQKTDKQSTDSSSASAETTTKSLKEMLDDAK